MGDPVGTGLVAIGISAVACFAATTGGVEVFVSSLRPAILNRDGAALDPAEFAQPLHKSGPPRVHGYGRAGAQDPVGGGLRRRRARGARPGRRAADERDDLAAFPSPVCAAV